MEYNLFVKLVTQWWIRFLDEKKARPMEIKEMGGFAFWMKKRRDQWK
jgi:hypothetical protein